MYKTEVDKPCINFCNIRLTATLNHYIYRQELWFLKHPRKFYPLYKLASITNLYCMCFQRCTELIINDRTIRTICVLNDMIGISFL